MRCLICGELHHGYRRVCSRCQSDPVLAHIPYSTLAQIGDQMDRELAGMPAIDHLYYREGCAHLSPDYGQR